METINCNLCGSEEYRVVYSMPDRLYFNDEWFTVVECKSCGLGFVNPRPTYSEIFRYYPPSFYESFEKERVFHQRRYRNQAKFLTGIPMGKDKNILLDVGCANGDFPRYMQTIGWEVEGVEVSPNSKPISDFKIYNQEFTDIPIHEAYYDAITAWAVLEHVHNPMSYFRKAAEVLKPGGFFVFLVTNFESISSKNLFREDLPRHLYFFTEKTVKEYLEKSGLELLRSDYSDQIYSMRPVNWLRYYVYRYLKKHNLKWEDIPLTRIEYFNKNKLNKNLWSNLQYAVSQNPFTLVDIMLMPLFEKYQMLSKSYGIVTYIATKH
ncbi:class I SAM-dependent methyltransferase [Allocoleopsis franciscana]|uniref:Methylase involved in ubiquinone/menaquinone biosynthesis n=1 Tax=Allocoleopsis franciscana PCC 7113 TaxID=1173027 RepID=K9WKH0_9CYAN|nr:class I SAM-dependent methyltransferase [Allocoleopsis franciscana]AFZ20910.1 methylase involved in ubiquinone/menaquinone biosynthesis [Allocoleopsis franciscana PCC 7113]